MKRWIALLLSLLALLSLPACGQSPAPAPTDRSGRYPLSGGGEAIIREDGAGQAAAAEDNSRVFYEIFVGSFSDSNGDGVGDLRGIIQRMDYLNDGKADSGLSLGVEGLWLTPVFDSPSYHKYDVDDYYSIDPAFGSLEDLDELIALCHERNVKLILDLPINHTGKNSVWFKRFVNAHKNGLTDDPYYDFYAWCAADQRPAGRSFSAIPGCAGQLYECNFSGDMPELNFDNDFVRQSVLDVAAFYLKRGVDGFRFDAAKYLYLGEHEKNVAFWSWYLEQLHAISPALYTVAEVWDGDGITDLYYPVFNCFDFSLSQGEGLIASTAKQGSASRYTAYVQSYLERVRALRPDAMLVPFIANHDTDRAAGFLTVASGQMQMAANLYLLSPGSPFIYYGEELGMRGSRGGANTDANRRLAMLWGDGDTVRDPVGTSYDAAKQLDSSVAQQLGDGDSLYSYYKRLLLIRRANPEIARGDYRALPLRDTRLGGFIASLDGSAVCVLHNPSLSPATVDLAALSELSFTELRAVIGQEDASLDGTVLTLGAQTSVVLK